MICLLNILNTESGNRIANDMLSWLKPLYNVIEFRHDGSKFEGPGIEHACQLCISQNEPCLYLHTKGAFYSTPNFTDKSLIPTLMGKHHIPIDQWQSIVRNLWKHEFTSSRRHLYETAHSQLSSIPLVTAPYVCIRNGTTWYNGFIMNSLAAKNILNIMPNATSRFYYEQLPGYASGITTLGLRIIDVDQTKNVSSYEKMIEDTIHFYTGEL